MLRFKTLLTVSFFLLLGLFTKSNALEEIDGCNGDVFWGENMINCDACCEKTVKYDSEGVCPGYNIDNTTCYSDGEDTQTFPEGCPTCVSIQPHPHEPDWYEITVLPNPDEDPIVIDVIDYDIWEHEAEIEIEFEPADDIDP